MIDGVLDPPVLSDVTDGVMTITLNRPRRKNAMGPAGWAALYDAVRAAAYDDAVRAVVVTGAERTFCAGADISGAPVGHPVTRVRNISRTAEALYSLAKPTVAKVEGHAVGAGWNLALCCDLVVTADDAKFSQIFAKRALSLDFGGSWLLPRLAGLQQAKRLAFLSELVSAQEAKELGLATWVVAPDEIDAFVDDLAERLAQMPPIAVAQNKELLNAGMVLPMREALDSEARAQAVNYATDDAPAARRAFQEKTEATFTGEWSIR
ncbi:enoyl-CoA hydratase/isomerase family protein [Mumia sp. DW29H23]|uniref:enoyl-CoA hydratase/isomerase family protein n=1 Tax=Mumia sp. DW29H23 TaxID=3421241 RepID=UPI003D69B676